MKALALAVIVIALMLLISPVGAQGAISPVATPFSSPIGTPYPTAIQLTVFTAR